MFNPSLIVGRPVSRVDGPQKVTGTARYAAEWQAEDMLHGYVVVSTVAAGRIRSIDTEKAASFPGVVKIYTYRNRPPVKAQKNEDWQDEVAPPGDPLRPLDMAEIRYDGEPVAFVVATSFEAARDAADLITLSYDTDEAETEIDSAIDRAYAPPELRSGIAPPPEPRGDAQAAYSAAPFKISGEYKMAGEYHNPIELFASTVIVEEDGSLTVHDKTQGSQNSRDYLCSVFGLDPSRIKVQNAFVGGAFGSALRPKYQLFLAVMAGLDLKRSITVELSRREMFYLTWRPASVQQVSLAADAEGMLQSVIHHAVEATSLYEDYQEVVVNWSGLAYRCDNAKLTYELTKLNRSTPGDMRAPGAVTGVFALETAMDELAYAVNIDPLELRIRNFIGRDQNEDKALTSKALDDCYRDGARAFGWDRRSMAPRSMREGRDLIGWGVATGFWDAQMMEAEARIRLDADGTVTVSAAASDIGTGTYTILAQIAAEECGVEARDVKVMIGDSDLPKTSVQGGSWTAASSGSAVQAAGMAIRKTLLAHAQARADSPLRDAKPEDVAIREGRLVLAANDQTGLDIADILSERGLDHVEETAKAAPDEAVQKKYSSYTHSAVFVEVRIDEELGVLRVTRVVSAIAAGRILNPKTARSQILGGIVMGMGAALQEEGMVDHRSGRIMNHNLAEYHIPVHADMGEIEIIFVDEKDDKASPIGVKGLGEIGIVGVAPAIANAIFHATGKRLRDLPITLDRIFDAVHSQN